ncbi:MAG: hypothetical protein KJ831_10745 [Candidatus Eisenbacteria bacterium]|nr:hypothetical protein [Candidatus Eisenbacteria bacterium]
MGSTIHHRNKSSSFSAMVFLGIIFTIIFILSDSAIPLRIISGPWSKSLENYASESTYIVIGELIESRCFIEEADSQIYTEFRLKTERFLKGGQTPDSTIVFRTSGGLVDGIARVCSDKIPLEVGHKYLLLIKFYLEGAPWIPSGGANFLYVGHLGARIDGQISYTFYAGDTLSTEALIDTTIAIIEKQLEGPH